MSAPCVDIDVTERALPVWTRDCEQALPVTVWTRDCERTLPVWTRESERA